MASNITELKAIAPSAPMDAQVMEMVVAEGDLSKMNPKHRVEYYGAVCKSMGLNPLTKPFEYIRLNNKLTLYATRGATDQLRALHSINLSITSREIMDDIYIVTCKGTMPDGRTDESTGAVSIGGLKGEAKANAMLKGETKAKRRLTLSMVGLGWLDESEVASIPSAQTVRVDMETGEIQEALPVTPPVVQSQAKSLDRKQISGAIVRLIKERGFDYNAYMDAIAEAYGIQDLKKISTEQLQEQLALLQNGGSLLEDEDDEQWQAIQGESE